MLHQRGRLSLRLVMLGSRNDTRMLCAILGAMFLVACAPAADSTAWSSAPKVELEVGVATNCEAGVDVVIEVDDETFTFSDLELAGQADSDLPYSGTIRVPWNRGGPYRITMLVGCNDSRVKEITTYRVEGDERTLVATTTTTGSGVATSAGGM